MVGLLAVTKAWTNETHTHVEVRARETVRDGLMRFLQTVSEYNERNDKSLSTHLHHLLHLVHAVTLYDDQ